MDKWLVPLAVAVVAAIATIGAAYLAAAKDRRDERTTILRDLEIAGKLAEGSRARRVLELDINDRVEKLTAQRERTSASWRMVALVSASYFLVAGIYVGKAASESPWRIAEWAAFAMAWWLYFVLVFVTVRSHRREAEKNRIEALREVVDDQQRPVDSEDETPPPA